MESRELADSLSGLLRRGRTVVIVSHRADVLKDVDKVLVLYEGAGHAFMNDTRPEMHRPEAAADAWARMVPFFRTHLV